MNIRLIISDFDGTLVNTFYANFQAYKKAFIECGLNLTEEEYRFAFGFRYDNFMEFKKIQDEKIKNRIKELKSDYYPNYFNYLIPNECLINLINNFHLDGGKTILASTASKKNLSNVINYFDLNKMFDITLTGEDVHNGKPNPEIYLLAISKYNFDKKSILVFEDSLVGIQAAESAGLNYIKIGNNWYGN